MPAGPGASTVMLAGTVITGAVVSATVTVKVLLAGFAWLPTAVHVTVVAPIGNVDPLAGVQPTATVPSRMSVADAVNVKTAPAALVASTVAFAGTVTAGAVVSRTVTVKVFVPVFPCVSVDRKSTRLNSSHLVISYAVFCLKKKTSTNH